MTLGDRVSESTLRAQPARRRAPRARRAHGRRSAAGRCRSSTRGVLEEHRACRERRGRVRRVAPRHRCGCTARARSRRCSGRSPTTSTGSRPAGRSTRTCSTPTTRTSSTTSSCGGSAPDELPRDAERVEHRPHRRRAAVRRRRPRRRRVRRRRRHRDARGARGAGARGARDAARDGGARAAGGRRASASQPVDVGGVPGCVAGTGYTGEDGVELHVPGRARAGGVGRAARRRRSRPPASAPATRCGSRPGCRCTATSSAPGITPLQAGLGWVVRLDKGDFRGRDARSRPSSERGVARRLRGPASSRPPDPACGVRRCSRDGDGRRRGHERQLLADARARHRARVPAARRRRRRRASRSTSAAATSPATVVTEAAVRPPVGLVTLRARGRFADRHIGPDAAEIADHARRRSARVARASCSTAPCREPIRDRSTARPARRRSTEPRRSTGLRGARRPQRGAHLADRHGLLGTRSRRR